MAILNFLFPLIFLFQLQIEQPTFKGGKGALESFFRNNQIYPAFSRDNCIQGKITVSFKINSTGMVYSSEVEKGLGVDLDDEALRLVRLSSGKWIIPSGYDTTQTIILPISFALSQYQCEQRDKDEIKKIIAAYKTQQELAKVVINYYSKPDSLKTSAANENAILLIKEQLGFDERYSLDLLKQAKHKLKQGDKQGACEDFTLIKNLGSSIANDEIKKNCH